MNKWLKSPLIATFLLSSVLEAAPLANHDRDYEVIGQFRQRTYNSLASQIAAQLFEEASKTDRLYESMSFELELSKDFGDHAGVGGTLRYSRDVDVDNPNVDSDRLGPFDYSEYRVTNTIFTGFDGKLNAGILKSGAKGGVFFAVSKKVVPRHSTLPTKRISTDSLEDICKEMKDTYVPLMGPQKEGLVEIDGEFELLKSASCKVNPDCKNGKDKNGNKCEEVDSGFFTNFAEGFAAFLNRPIRYVGEFFADTEKTKIYLDQPAEAFTNYTRYGFPVDLDVFWRNNTLLGVGDSIQHSVFYGWSPLSIGTDYGLGNLSFNIFKQTRAVRDIRVRKEENNKVTVQVTDYLSKGRNWQFFKVRPKLLFIFKYSFADWRHRDFDTMTYTRTYEIDLNEGATRKKDGKVYSTGMKFLKNIVRKGWLVDLELNPDRLNDEVELPAGVVAKTPTFTSGPRAHSKFMLRFPGIFKVKATDNKVVKVSRIGKDKAQGEADRSHTLERAWDLTDWGPFRKTRQKTKCSLNTKTYATPQAYASDNTIISDKLSLNIDCYHREKYPNKNWALLASDTATIMNDANVEPGFQQEMRELDVKSLGRLNFVSNVSFNHKHLTNFLKNATMDRVMVELADIYFGPEYAKLWQEIGYRGVMHYIRGHNPNQRHSRYVPYANQNTYGKPGHACEALEGIAGTRKGLAPFFVNKSQTCLQLAEQVIFPLAYDIKRIRDTKLEEYDNKIKYIKEKLKNIAEAYPNRDVTFALAILIRRLADETPENPVHSTYSVDSSRFLESITYSNGKPFRVEHMALKDSIPDALDFKDS